MENLLLDALVEVVGYRPDEHTLREVGNLACRNEAVHLGVDGDGGLVPVDGHVLPLSLIHIFQSCKVKFPGLAEKCPVLLLLTWE